jgi:uncharacterized SAM-binding protein YcdF (DUF218 family)
MFYVISKLFTIFLMPFFWLFFSICLSCFAKTDKVRKKSIRFSFFVIMIFGNSFLASKIMHWWEPKPLDYANMANFDIGVVLGGGIANEWKKPLNRIHFDHSADRLLQAFQLYKAGKIKKILISGGSASIFKRNNKRTDATISRDFLLKVGVPEADIIVEANSINTYENALFTKNVLIAKKLQKAKLLLITSAYHMARSEACFQKQGLEVVAFPAAYHSLNLDLWSFSSFVPAEESFGIWYDLFHEWFGTITYKIVGYI